MRCAKPCKICNRLIISTAVSVQTVGGTDTLVIDLPAGLYANGCNYCVVVAQAVPDTATINMPVAFTIGGVATTVYPFNNCDCTQVTACGVRTRTRYPVKVITTPAGGAFKSLTRLCGYPNTVLTSLPVTPTTGG